MTTAEPLNPLVFACPGCRATLAADDGSTRCPHCDWRGEAYTFTPRVLAVDVAENALPDDAVCLHHPTKKATAVCAGTGDYICTLCSVDIEGQTYSADYLNAGGHATAVKAFDRKLNRPDGQIYLYVLCCFIPGVNYLALPLAFAWVPHAFFLYAKALKQRRENPIFARVMGKFAVVAIPIVLSLVGTRLGRRSAGDPVRRHPFEVLSVAVDLRSNTMFSRVSLLAMPDSLVKLEHSRTEDRVKRFKYDTIENVLIWRTMPWVRLVVVTVVLVLPGVALLFVQDRDGVSLVLGIILIVIGLAFDAFYLVCRNTTIRITRVGRTDDIKGIFRPRKVRKLRDRLLAGIRATQAFGSTDEQVQTEERPPDITPPLPA